MEILQPGHRLIVLGTIYMSVLMRGDAGRCFPVVTPECQDKTHNQENGVPSGVPEINHGGLLPDAQYIPRPGENQGGDLPDRQFIPPPVGDYGVPPADGNYGIPPADGNYGIPQQDGNYGTPPQNGKDPKCFYVRIREDFQHPPDYPEYVDIPDGHSVYERAGHRERDRMQVPDPYWVRPPKHKIRKKEI
ncbi:uncharacterized protein LOC117900778 [Drosophila subobscura]|uniref:uncharacterized protein LOC117900778 n=1 Tax=Drosophila subobscura TaxID=7241 RepID=UPI00155A2F99|nr:uncharacterized protein LOC117900778 [Drosophila subobscura]